MSRRTSTLVTALAAVALAAGLAGCGKLGSLERPGPMFGRTANGAATPSEQHQDPNRPVQTVDPRDPDPQPSPK